MANGKLNSRQGVVDRQPILKIDTFRSKDFVAAVNCNFDLYTGFDRREEMRRRVREAFAAGQKIKC